MGDIKHTANLKLNQDSPIVVGGGLFGSFIALTLQRRFGINSQVIEKEQVLGGNHTWSFNSSDISKDVLELFSDLIFPIGSGSQVFFSDFHRDLPGQYYSIKSESLDQVMKSDFIEQGGDLRLSETHQSFDSYPWEIDCTGRGPAVPCGFQNFYGIEIETEGDHRIATPIIMDTRVDQLGEYRFFYVLPFGSNRLLIEDTRFSASSFKGDEDLHQECVNYIETHLPNVQIKRVLRRERGALPLPLQNYDFDKMGLSLGRGMFHPTTGYSTPVLFNFIDRLIRRKEMNHAIFEFEVNSFLMELHRKQRFFITLNRLFFIGAKCPEEKINIFKNFYRLDPQVISRFYNMSFTWFDRLKLFAARPPIPITNGLSVLMRGAYQRDLEPHA